MALLPELSASLRPLLARLGVPSGERDDLVQDVLLAAHASLPRFSPELGSMRAWIHGIAFHVATHERARARHRRERAVADAGAHEADAALPADEQLAREQLRALVRATLAGLATNDRRVLLSHDADGVAMATVAASLGVPMSTAYKWLYRARSRLRDALVRKDRRRRVDALFRAFRGLFARRGDVYLLRERTREALAARPVRVRLARRSRRRGSASLLHLEAARLVEALVARAPARPRPVPFPVFGGLAPRKKQAALLVSGAPFDSSGACVQVEPRSDLAPRPYPERREARRAKRLRPRKQATAPARAARPR